MNSSALRLGASQGNSRNEHQKTSDGKLAQDNGFQLSRTSRRLWVDVLVTVAVDGFDSGNSLTELPYSASDARFDGTQGNFQNLCDFIVRPILQIEQGQSGLINRIHL